MIKIPQDDKLELEVISSAITNQDKLYNLMQYSSKIFYNEKHRMIYNILKDLFDSNENIDFIVLMNQIRETGNYDKLKDTFELLITAGSSVNYNYMIKTLYKYEFKRRLIKETEKFQKGMLKTDEFIESIITLNDEFENDDKDEIFNFNDFIKQSPDKIFNDGTYIKTGIRDLDEKIVGMFNGQFYVIAGRPGSGKTTFAWQIARNIVNYHKDNKVLFFTWEMTKTEMYAKMLSDLCDIETWKIESNKMSDEEMNRLIKEHTRLQDKVNIDMYDRAYNFQHCRNIINRKMKKGNVKAIFFDYLQRIPGGTGENQNQRITSISNQIKDMAIRYKIPIIVLSQLSRSIEREKRFPIPSDLRDSGTIEQDADVIQFIHTTDKGKTDEKHHIIIAKNRKNNTGTLEDENDNPLLTFNKKYSRFEKFIEEVPSFDNLSKTEYFHD